MIQVSQFRLLFLSYGGGTHFSYVGILLGQNRIKLIFGLKIQANTNVETKISNRYKHRKRSIGSSRQLRGFYLFGLGASQTGSCCTCVPVYKPHIHCCPVIQFIRMNYTIFFANIKIQNLDSKANNQFRYLSFSSSESSVIKESTFKFKTIIKSNTYLF